MYIDVQDIVSMPNKKVEKSIEMDGFTFGYMGVDYSITDIKPFNLCLTNDNNKELLISGETSIHVVIPCDRCLEDVDNNLDIVIGRELKLEDGQIKKDVDEDDDFVVDMQLDVVRLIFDEILVNWPAKVLCKDDCKGICPVCGQNLNEQDCGCDRHVIDPRMAKFQDIFDQFKEV